VKIRHIEIKNFRGISLLEWAPSDHMNCLIGAGDSGKTTILDAIDLTLAPRYQANFYDADFFKGKHEQPIQITIMLGDLPEEFKALSKYGEYLRGWDATNQVIIDEPDEGSGLEYVLSVRLTVDHTLEPKWSFYTERFVEDTRPEWRLRFEDRQMIAPTRLGVYTDRHLAWGKQSILLRLTRKDTLGGNILTQARRAARNHFKESGEKLFQDVVGQIAILGSSVGVKFSEDISARLDVEGISVTSGGISLHEGDVPLRLLGMGSARLLVAALQDHAAKSAPFALIDEVENGLEPHRISRLLRYLKSERGNVRPQLFVTTHSPVVLQELNVSDLAIVRRNISTGVVTVTSAKTDMDEVDAQAQLRTTPYAYLAQSVLVCEGKTEVGIMRGLDQYYYAKKKLEPFATAGVWATDGKGKDRAPKVAKYFRNLQYRVALFLDNDKDPDDAKILTEIEQIGVKILRWEKGKATEDVLFCDLSDAAVKRLVELLENEEGLSAIPDQINSIAGSELVVDWSDLKNRCAESKMRVQLAVCAKTKSCSWIKNRIALCESIGLEVLGPELDNLKKGNAACVKELRAWIDSE
jgi:putative ATP-dependent endonuclease of OLD family